MGLYWPGLHPWKSNHICIWKVVKEIDDVDGGIEAKIKFLESDGIYNEWLNHFYEVREIDKFIKEEYPKLINKVKSSSYTESNNYEQELDEKINDILIRIVKIRKMMWTWKNTRWRKGQAVPYLPYVSFSPIKKNKSQASQDSEKYNYGYKWKH